jgi:hypothetical protein
MALRRWKEFNFLFVASFYLQGLPPPPIGLLTAQVPVPAFVFLDFSFLP